MQLKIPHRYEPRTYQIPLLKALDSGCKRAIIFWHRRSGKDKTCFNYMVRCAAQKVGTYFYLLPTYAQAKKVIWDNIDNDGMRMLDHIPSQLIKNTNATELKIELVNGSIIQLIGADVFKESGVGTNPIGVVFSEWPICSPSAWDYLRPILAANGGWAIFNGTSRGKNHAWEMLQKAKDDASWFWEVLTVNDTNAIPQDVLEQERKEMPQALFEQEWLCAFIDGAGQFFRRIHENTYAANDNDFEDGEVLQLGVDLAKYQDWTVITPFNLNTFRVLPQDRFNQVDWNLQKARIEAAALRYNNARVKIDATGVGDPIVEDLKARGLNISDDDAVKFTEQTRMNLLNNLSMLLEQDKIKIPYDEGLISELEAFRYTLTQTGKLRVGAPEGLHDDRVMSLALAVDGVKEPLGRRTGRRREEEFSLYTTTYD